MDKMTRAHCEFLRSDLEHIKLNGFSLVRTDPYEGGDAVLPHTNPTNLHIDNAFLAAHDAATPREVYSRSITYLNEGGVSEGGAPIVVWPRAHKAAAEVVQRLLSEQGDDAYHGVRWRDEVTAALAQLPPDADPEADYDTREVLARRLIELCPCPSSVANQGRRKHFRQQRGTAGRRKSDDPHRKNANAQPRLDSDGSARYPHRRLLCLVGQPDVGEERKQPGAGQRLPALRARLLPLVALG